MGQGKVLCTGIFVPLLLAGIGCAGDGGDDPRVADYAELLGTWTLQVQSNASCAGPGPSGALVLQIQQTAADVATEARLLFLENATSSWSGGGQSGGYVTGSMSLFVPGSANIYLVAGAPVQGSAPPPNRVASLSGTVTEGLGFTGTLTDPTPDQGYVPLFSSACVYQVTGHHG